MKKFIIVIICLVTMLHGYTIEYVITSNQANKLVTATTYFYPVPQINVGTEQDPIWQDSCSDEEWTKHHYRQMMRKTWERYSEKIKKDTITADPW